MVEIEPVASRWWRDDRDRLPAGASIPALLAACVASAVHLLFIGFVADGSG